MPSQLRDSRGRFVKETDYEYDIVTGRPLWEKFTEFTSEELGIPAVDYLAGKWQREEDELKIARSVRLAIWWSENWGTVVGYVAYAVLCFVFGIIGGVFGVRVSL